LWNALPGVDKRLKVGDRNALIDELWWAIERLPDPEPRADRKRPSKQDVVIAMLRQPEGATVDEVVSVTGWQRHTVERQSPSRPRGRQRSIRHGSLFAREGAKVVVADVLEHEGPGSALRPARAGAGRAS